MWCKDKVRHSYYADDVDEGNAGPRVDANGQIVHNVSSSTSLVNVGDDMDEAKYELEAALNNNPSTLGAVAEEDEEEEEDVEDSSSEPDQQLDSHAGDDRVVDPGGTSGEKTIELTEVVNSHEQAQTK